MRAGVALLFVAAITGWPRLGLAQASAASPGCTFDVKVLDARRAWVNCGRTWPAGDWTFKLWEYDDDWERDPATRLRSGGEAARTFEGRVAKLTFTADALRPDKEYRLVIANAAATPSDPVVLIFNTRPEATLSTIANRSAIELRGIVALNPSPDCDSAGSATASSGSACELVEILTPRLLRPGATPIPPRQVAHPLAVRVNTTEDVATIGGATLTITEGNLSDGAVRVTFSGVTNVFGAKVTATGETGNVVPTTRDDAEYVFKVGLQAARTQRAAYSLDAVLRPTIAARGLTFWRLLGNVDLGHNDTLSANSIIVGTEVAFPFRQRGAGPIFGWKPVVRAAYETDKDGDVGNLLGTVEAVVRLRGLYRPRKVVQSIIAVRMSEELRQAISPIRVKSPDWGLIVPMQIGLDVGGAVRTATRDDASRPEGGRTTIARLRFGSGAIVEYKRLAITESVVVHYLLAEERAPQTGASAPPPFDGVKASNELVFKVSLDRLGHYALALTYKYGAAPPTYQTVDSLVSSVAILF